MSQIPSGHDTKHNLSVENQISTTRDSSVTLLKSSNRLIYPLIWSHTCFVF